MAIIHDMIPGFELFQPADLESALDVIHRNRDDCWVLAGGLDSMDWFKDRVKRPSVVVDLNGVAELHGIRETEDGGLEIGAMTSLRELSSSALVKERFSVLAEAAGLVATPQIRNQATVGGNVCQDTRCWYYRGGWPCYRAGGNICYADTPTSENREHCIFGASRCVAVSPSDTAPALLVLDAQMVVLSSSGERTLSAESFFMGPAKDITRMTALEPGEVLATIRIPGKWAGKSFYFEKVRDRKSWDFALASIAMAVDRDGTNIGETRIALGAIAPTPIRIRRSETILRNGSTETADLAERAAEASVVGARPLANNDYKIPLVRNLVSRAVRATTA